MGVSYETDPQSNLAWFREQFRNLSGRIDDVVAQSRQSTSRGGTVVGSWLLTGPVSGSGAQTLNRRGRSVHGNVRVAATAAIAQYGLICALPAGFKPDPLGNDLIWPGAVNTSGSWAPMTFYCSAADGSVRPLTGSVASGATAAFSLVPFLAGA